MFLYGKKKFYIDFFYWKKFYNINENVKIYIYLIWEIYFYAENAFVSNKI